MKKVEPGYVYLLTNACIRDPEDREALLVKIGSATDFDSRMGTLNSALPFGFIIHMAVLSDDCRGLEAEIHRQLDKCRVNPKAEFFRGDIKVLKDEVRRIAVEYCKEQKLAKPKFITKIAQYGRAAATVKRNRERLFGGEIRFVCKHRDGEAFAHFEREDAFVVEKGSYIARTCADSFDHSRPKSYYQAWDKLVHHGLDSEGRLLTDEYYPSRAFAASVVCGGIRNGNKEWVEISDEKTPRTLGEYFGKQPNSKG